MGRAGRSTDTPRTQAAVDPRAACVLGVSVDRSPRTRGGIGCTSSCYPRLRFASVALRLRVEARSVPPVLSVPFDPRNLRTCL